MITLENISLAYGSRLLLDNISATFGTGTLTALLGRNGTGKSTLLRTIAALQPAAAGRILADGDDIRSLRPSERARRISFVTTDKVRIPNLTCREVAALGRAPYTDWIGRLSDEDNAIVEQALAAVDMLSFAEKSMERLSDGECQRVMIARALAQQTPAILLDEPTAFLDLPARYETVHLLHRLAREEGKTVIYSTHDLDTALADSDCAALLDTPKLICRTIDELRRCGDIERIFGIVNTGMQK